MAYKQTPPDQKRRRNASVAHAKCADKRTLLKERIRKLEQQTDDLSSEILLADVRWQALHDALSKVVEVMGLEIILDPFGNRPPETPGKQETI